MSTFESSRTGRPHVVVTGLIAAGKSTVAELLAERLACDHLDSDEQIEVLVGSEGGDIAAAEGVEALHRLEAGVLLGALSLPRRVVISAAASTIESSWCRVALSRRAHVIWLDIDADEAHRRASAQDHRRPIDLDELASLAASRRSRFEEVADLRLDALRPVDELVADALAAVTVPPS